MSGKRNVRRLLVTVRSFGRWVAACDARYFSNTARRSTQRDRMIAPSGRRRATGGHDRAAHRGCQTIRRDL